MTELKEQLEDLRREVDRGEGALASTLKRITKDFGCKTIEEADEALVRLRKSRDRRGAKLTKALRRFERKFGDDLK